jgi:hypothetical protein
LFHRFTEIPIWAANAVWLSAESIQRSSRNRSATASSQSGLKRVVEVFSHRRGRRSLAAPKYDRARGRAPDRVERE